MFNSQTLATKRVAVTLIAVLAATAALAKKDKGEFQIVFANGQVIKGSNVRTTVPATWINGTRFHVVGTYNDFWVDANTFATYDYRLTGKGDRGNVTGGVPTTIWTEKVPLHGMTLTSEITLRINKEQLIMTRNTPGLTMKIQAKDMTQGGLFQMEPSKPVSYRHTLAPGFLYQKDAFGRVVATNGVFFVRESPENAVLTNPSIDAITGMTQSFWLVQPGGRMGGVIGEDALQP